MKIIAAAIEAEAAATGAEAAEARAIGARPFLARRAVNALAGAAVTVAIVAAYEPGFAHP
ncbi:hypothetical protein [Kitasatospora sp. NPDC001175]|uniref:hypothetical protein n=1 Tax=Kitasatospora sp. NPDC001175 TaxID=3157103 RepID=UPI003D028E54